MVVPGSKRRRHLCPGIYSFGVRLRFRHGASMSNVAEHTRHKEKQKKEKPISSTAGEL